MLDSPISAGGGNLSVGQGQILALARAIMRGSQLYSGCKNIHNCDPSITEHAGT